MSYSVEKISPTSFDPVVADELAQSIAEAIEYGGRCSLVLAGGQTPGSIYRLLSKPPRSNLIDWTKVHLFWGDERWVAKDHNSSNYKLVHDTLFHGVEVPAENIHAFNCSLASCQATAADYDTQIREFFKVKSPVVPEFDIVLLGIGADGHTASLFPGTKSLNSQELACESTAVEEPRERVTLTFPVLRAAKRVYFMVKGASKAEILAKIILDKSAFIHYPAAFFHEAKGKTTWFVDSEAGKFLE